MRIWDALEAGEILEEHGAAWFYSRALGDLALTDRRLFFGAQWEHEELSLSVPLDQIAECVEGRRLRFIGTGHQVVVRLRDSSFPLRFGFSTDPKASCEFVAAVQLASHKSGAGAMSTFPVEIEIQDGVIDRVRSTSGKLYLWCEPTLRGSDLRIKAEFAPPKEIEFFTRWSDERRFNLFLSSELRWFNKVTVSTDLGKCWASIPSP